MFGLEAVAVGLTTAVSVPATAVVPETAATFLYIYFFFIKFFFVRGVKGVPTTIDLPASTIGFRGVIGFPSTIALPATAVGVKGVPTTIDLPETTIGAPATTIGLNVLEVYQQKQ